MDELYDMARAAYKKSDERSCFMFEALTDCAVAMLVGVLLAMILPTRWPTDPKSTKKG